MRLGIAARRRLSAVTVALAVLAGAASAQAANQRIAISDYRWSEPEIQLDLGEHVTWHWTGPDTMHSVTGVSANATAIESDPGVSMPNHAVGDTFQATFDEPGSYRFQCRLHSSVRGTVEVSAEPGDPVAEPDPVPPNRIDVVPPHLSEVRPVTPSFRRGEGRLHFALDERATVNAEYWRLRSSGGREYRGWQEWNGHIGLNDARLATGKRFRPRSGRYVALVDATDAANNRGRTQRLRFTIR